VEIKASRTPQFHQRRSRLETGWQEGTGRCERCRGWRNGRPWLAKWSPLPSSMVDGRRLTSDENWADPLGLRSEGNEEGAKPAVGAEVGTTTEMLSGLNPSPEEGGQAGLSKGPLPFKGARTAARATTSNEWREARARGRARGGLWWYGAGEKRRDCRVCMSDRRERDDESESDG